MSHLRRLGICLTSALMVSLAVSATAFANYGPSYEPVEIEEKIPSLVKTKIEIESETTTPEEEEEAGIVNEATATIENKTNTSDLRYMASIIYAEAGDQCLAGQEAVGIVVMNRSESPEWANGIYNVIYEKGQFTPVYDGNMKKALAIYDSGTMPSSCFEAAEYAMNGNKSVYYNGSTINLGNCYYFATKLSNAKYHIQGHYFK